MTSPPPPGVGPNADALANTARVAAEQVVAQQVGQVATFLAGGGLASESVDDLSWQVNRLAEIARLRRQLALSSREATKAATAQVPGMLADVAQRAAGGLDVQVQTLTEDLVGALIRMWSGLPTLLTGKAEIIVISAASQVRVGNLTRVQATAQAADRMVAQGIAPARDRAGRQWTAPAYTEMIVRTSVMDAGRTGRETQAVRFGTPYVQVSDALRECPMCRPWEGKILTLDGTDPEGIAQGTLAEARAAGLGHPNCRHLWAGYFPAYSSRVQPTPDSAGWEASKRQRELERRVRAAKLRQQTAETIDPGGLTAQAAKTRVRDAQRQLREHVKATGQRRKPDRERVPQAS
ncbi:MAG: phage capsid protein [Spirosoma sp.]|nr:phage capsid protein [Spirosoma sp.]